MRTGWFVALLGFCCYSVTGVPYQALYPYGDDYGDIRLDVQDDVSSEEIVLDTPIAFYDDRYRTIYVNSNGHLSFESPIPNFQPGQMFPTQGKIIAPFMADVDTRLTGNIFYRETANPSLLELATGEIQRHFPGRGGSFRAAGLLIVTWDAVGYYEQQYMQTNTFQVVIASDGYSSFAFYQYTDDGLEWVQAQGGKGRGDLESGRPAEVGFNAGDQRRYLTLPGSGRPEVEQLNLRSNVGVPGMWMFHIGLLDGAEVQQPDAYTDGNSEIPGPDSENVEALPRTCGEGGYQICHQNAQCSDSWEGFCCRCNPPAIGNGRNCVAKGGAQRISGKVSGTVNGISIVEQDVHAYVVTADGRAYTAMSRVPLDIGVPLQTAFPIGTVIGWLFAKLSTPDVKNGFMVTGGDVNHTAIMRYFPGGETLEIQQTFYPHDEQGYMRIRTTLRGNVPRVLASSKVTVDDYDQEFTRASPGVLKSYGEYTYRVDDIAQRYTLEQTINYHENCREIEDEIGSIRLSVVRVFLVYGAVDEIVRYATTNRISSAGPGPGNVCERNDCDPNAQCYPEVGTYRCECKPGYEGDGRYCRDVDECALRMCDINAECYNSEGSFQCRCRSGYRGDGTTCVRDLSCGDLLCDPNAHCVFDSNLNKPMCECDDGFYGDGLYCEQVEFSCNEVNNCHPNADCVYSQFENRYVCECFDGFSGDGYTCTDGGSTEIGCDSCDVNARCVFDVARLYYRCVCNEGFTGDGVRCDLLEEQSCDIVNNCHYDASCVQGRPGGEYVCVCNYGFRGDGYSCEPDYGSQDCQTVNNCDPNAQCLYDRYSDRFACSCNPGYTGDGMRCELEAEDCSVNNFCDANARCDYDYDNGRYVCKCNPGYEGDGRYCRTTDEYCNEVVTCDGNAECFYNDLMESHECRCKPGYEGDGYVCRAVGDCSVDPAICDLNARCTNRGNVYVCVCIDGYRGDGRRCAPIGDTSSYMVYAQGMSIMKLPYNPTEEEPGQQVLMVPGQTAVGIDVDCYSRYFYWTDVAGKSISRAKLDGTESEVILSGLGSPEGVAVDWIAKNIYWTDSELDTVEVANFDGTNRKLLFDIELVNPRAIVVDPGRGLVFWTDWNRDAPKIERANMDGTERRPLITGDLGLPNGLTIDYRESQLCWADAGTQRIECSDYEGFGRRVIYELASYPFSIAFNNNILYWTDWEQKTLQSIDKYGGEPNQGLQLPVVGNGRLYGISIVRECPAGSNACVLNNGGCRFLCLPTPNGGRTCICPDDIDEEQCNEVGLLQ